MTTLTPDTLNITAAHEGKAREILAAFWKGDLFLSGPDLSVLQHVVNQEGWEIVSALTDGPTPHLAKAALNTIGVKVPA